MTDAAPGDRAWAKRAAAFATAALVLHLAAGHGYGYSFREVSLFRAMDAAPWSPISERPLTDALFRLTCALFGESAGALRVLPALCAAGTVVLGAWIVRRLGGGALAQWLAGVLLVLSPAVLVPTGTFGPRAFGLLAWTAATALLLAIVEKDPAAYEYEGSEAVLGFRAPPAANPGLRLWLTMGCVVGLGSMAAPRLAWLVAALPLALLATRDRRWLTRPWPWLGAAVALFLVTPQLVWQWLYDWPITECATQPIDEGRFALGQIVAWVPLAAPLIVVGLLRLFRDQDGRYRALGVAYLVAAAILLVTGERSPSALTGATIPLIAAGAVTLERAAIQRQRLLVGRLAVAVIAISSLVLAPLSLPVLPLARFQGYDGYAHALGLDAYGGGDWSCGAFPGLASHHYIRSDSD